MGLRIIKEGKNQSGMRIAIAGYRAFRDTPETIGVYIYRGHYCSHVKGGLLWEWQYFKNNLSIENAEIEFEKRLKGKRKK